ncbi:MAG: hypothetical protein HZA17_02425 [Nitrospirae bacterium]|nr:hypothetical protein [Nitrospirota bacterium]
MGKTVVVSFEDAIVRIVIASIKGKEIIIHDLLTMPDDKFDDFLSREKTEDYLVIQSFRDFFQETVSIPATKKSLVRGLVESEIRKRSHIKDFSFLYEESGEKLVDNRRMKEVFLYAVPNEELRKTIQRFILRGKVVRAIYPDIFSLSCLIDSENMPVLCVSEAGLNKNLFLLNGGRMQFIRTAQSLEHGINDLDIQNINMTVNYCWQTMRLNPSLIALIGSISRDYHAAIQTPVPLACHARYRNEKITLSSFTASMAAETQDALLDFMSPISALYIPHKKEINILPEDYRRSFAARRRLQYAATSFIAASFLGVCLAVFFFSSMTGLRNRLALLREGASDAEAALAAYDKKQAELAAYAPFMESEKGTASAPDMQGFLAVLPDIRTDRIRIDSISLSAEGAVLDAELKGAVDAEGYADTQMHYERFLGALKGSKGISISKEILELRDRSFLVGIRWNPGGVPVKGGEGG